VNDLAWYQINIDQGFNDQETDLAIPGGSWHLPELPAEYRDER
jgi:hypothetical protein